MSESTAANGHSPVAWCPRALSASRYFWRAAPSVGAAPAKVRARTACERKRGAWRATDLREFLAANDIVGFSKRQQGLFREQATGICKCLRWRSPRARTRHLQIRIERASLLILPNPMVRPQSSAAGVLALLQEPDPIFKQHALKALIPLVPQFWAEISEHIAAMYAFSFLARDRTFF